MNIVQIVAAGLISALLAITIKKQVPEFALLISIGASVLIFFMIFPMLSETVQVLNDLSAITGTQAANIVIILKIIGIAYISEFGSQVCKDAGETAIASKIELGGKVIIMLSSVPILYGLIDIIIGIIP